FQESLSRKALDRLVPAHEGLHELELTSDLFLHMVRRLAIRCELHGALLQEAHSRVKLAALAALADEPYDFPGVALRNEEVAAITQVLGHLDQIPREQLLQSNANVGAGNPESLGDLIGV